MEKRFVKCPDCGNPFKTSALDGDEAQCPHTSGGCGHRFDPKGTVIKI